jgi:excisionase family DNA binding protein
MMSPEVEFSLLNMHMTMSRHIETVKSDRTWLEGVIDGICPDADPLIPRCLLKIRYEMTLMIRVWIHLRAHFEALLDALLGDDIALQGPPRKPQGRASPAQIAGTDRVPAAGPALLPPSRPVAGETDPVIDAVRASELLGIPVNTVKRMAHRGELPSIPFPVGATGKTRHRFRRSQLELYIESLSSQTKRA